uniref:Kinesin motor domain-containing protein n=1 Tax=Amphimedon queenslandica TaxID=400682 RepID=A0A1X7T763_AMPQE
MNERSSCSHLVFTLVLTQSDYKIIECEDYTCVNRIISLIWPAYKSEELSSLVQKHAQFHFSVHEKFPTP